MIKVYTALLIAVAMLGVLAAKSDADSMKRLRLVYTGNINGHITDDLT